MQLEQGSSTEVISRNIDELRENGHDLAQAAAIAYKVAGKARDGAPVTYLDLLKKIKQMKIDAIDSELQLIALAPESDKDMLLEIMSDENNHEAIFSEFLERYQAEAYMQ